MVNFIYFYKYQNHLLEERLFKQENQIDRLTRDKVSLTSEVESYKKKCNSIDFDTHQVISNYQFILIV